MPWQPPRNAARLGSLMRVTFGVIFAQTGFFAAAMTQPQTSCDDLGILAHRRAHFAFGQSVRAGKVQLKRIDPGILATLDDLAPGIAVVFFHDRRDEHAVRDACLCIF